MAQLPKAQSRRAELAEAFFDSWKRLTGLLAAATDEA
jgi:hypothetical protein